MFARVLAAQRTSPRGDRNPPLFTTGALELSCPIRSLRRPARVLRWADHASGDNPDGRANEPAVDGRIRSGGRSSAHPVPAGTASCGGSRHPTRSGASEGRLAFYAGSIARAATTRVDARVTSRWTEDRSQRSPLAHQSPRGQHRMVVRGIPDRRTRTTSWRTDPGSLPSAMCGFQLTPMRLRARVGGLERVTIEPHAARGNESSDLVQGPNPRGSRTTSSGCETRGPQREDGPKPSAPRVDSVQCPTTAVTAAMMSASLVGFARCALNPACSARSCSISG